MRAAGHSFRMLGPQCTLVALLRAFAARARSRLARRRRRRSEPRPGGGTTDGPPCCFHPIGDCSDFPWHVPHLCLSHGLLRGVPDGRGQPRQCGAPQAPGGVGGRERGRPFCMSRGPKRIPLPSRAGLRLFRPGELARLVRTHCKEACAGGRVSTAFLTPITDYGPFQNYAMPSPFSRHTTAIRCMACERIPTNRRHGSWWFGRF